MKKHNLTEEEKKVLLNATSLLIGLGKTIYNQREDLEDESFRKAVLDAIETSFVIIPVVFGISPQEVLGAHVNVLNQAEFMAKVEDISNDVN